MKKQGWFNSGVLYMEYPNEFMTYVDGLKKHNVKLSDLRLKQICKKWDIKIEWVDGFCDNTKSRGYWINGIWDQDLRRSANDLVNLSVRK